MSIPLCFIFFAGASRDNTQREVRARSDGPDGIKACVRVLFEQESGREREPQAEIEREKSAVLG